MNTPYLDTIQLLLKATQYISLKNNSEPSLFQINKKQCKFFKNHTYIIHKMIHLLVLLFTTNQFIKIFCQNHMNSSWTLTFSWHFFLCLAWGKQCFYSIYIVYTMIFKTLSHGLHYITDYFIIEYLNWLGGFFVNSNTKIYFVFIVHDKQHFQLLKILPDQTPLLVPS